MPAGRRRATWRAGTGAKSNLKVATVEKAVSLAAERLLSARRSGASPCTHCTDFLRSCTHCTDWPRCTSSLLLHAFRLCVAATDPGLATGARIGHGATDPGRGPSAMRRVAGFYQILVSSFAMCVCVSVEFSSLVGWTSDGQPVGALFVVFSISVAFGLTTRFI